MIAGVLLTGLGPGDRNWRKKINGLAEPGASLVRELLRESQGADKHAGGPTAPVFLLCRLGRFQLYCKAGAQSYRRKNGRPRSESERSRSH